jgi:hypothetical protein
VGQKGLLIPKISAVVTSMGKKKPNTKIYCWGTTSDIAK